MKMYTNQFQPNSYYHLFNRGINGENVFKQEDNYTYFLRKYAQIVTPSIETYAYCLLPNHFHLIIKTPPKSPTFNPSKRYHEQIGIILATFFRTYANAINHKYNRTGGLFESPVRRIIIDSDAYLKNLIQYIHKNPELHGIHSNFRDYPHSSFQALLSQRSTSLKRNEVLGLFNSSSEFRRIHEKNVSIHEISNLLLEH